MKKAFIAVILLANFGACASTGRNYVYYVIHPEVDRLYAKDPKDDLVLSEVCKPKPDNQGPCIGMKTDEYFTLKQELLELRSALETCQQGPQPVYIK